MPADSPFSWPARLALIAVTVAAIGYFADRPLYHVLAPDIAEVRLMVRHSGLPVTECLQKSAEELAELAPNMRQPISCPRGKSPLAVTLRMNDVIAFEGVIEASGLHGDGLLAHFERFDVEPGEINLEVLAETGDVKHVHSERVLLTPDLALLVQVLDDGIHSTIGSP